MWRYCTFNITTQKIYPQSHFLYIFLLLYIIGCLKENCIFSIWFLAISSSLTSVVFIFFNMESFKNSIALSFLSYTFLPFGQEVSLAQRARSTSIYTYSITHSSCPQSLIFHLSTEGTNLRALYIVILILSSYIIWYNTDYLPQCTFKISL